MKRRKYVLLAAFLLNVWFLTVSFSEAGITAAVFGVVLTSVTIFKLKEREKYHGIILGFAVFFSGIFLFNKLNVFTYTTSKTFCAMTIGSVLLAIVLGLSQSILISKKKITLIVVSMCCVWVA